MTGMEPFMAAAWSAASAAGTALTTAAPYIAAASTAVGAYGTYQASKAQEANYKTQQNIAEYQADAMEERATQERAVSHMQADQQRRAARRLEGKQIAQGAASGGGLYGSTLDVIGETAPKGEYNAEMELWQGEAKARGVDENAVIQRMEAASYGEAAKTTARSRPWQVGSSILTGLSNVAAKMPTGAPSYTGRGAVISTNFDDDYGWATETTSASPYRYG
jgi:hypothetical protein